MAWKPLSHSRGHGNHYPTQGLLLKYSAGSFLQMARKLEMHPLILIHHQPKATHSSMNFTALQGEGNGACRRTPICGMCRNAECPGGRGRAQPPVTHLMAPGWLLTLQLSVAHGVLPSFSPRLRSSLRSIQRI